MKEPAYSFLHDHSQLSIAKKAYDANSLLEYINPSLKNPLNESQTSVFKHSFENRVTLLWGPPGTGKTTTLAAIVLGWIENAIANNTNINIGVGSSTWTAIDNLLADILVVLEKREAEKGNFGNPINIYRIRSSSGNPFVHHKIQDTVVYSNEARNLKRELDNNTSISICGSTWKQYYNLSKSDRRSDASDKKWFDLLLIDEASQVKVEHAAAYFLNMKLEGHLVLAGDDKQLGPIHGFQMEDNSDGLYDCIYSYMKDTHRVEPQTIVDNYRSNWNINEWPNRRFYNGKLTSKNPENLLQIELPHSKPQNWPADLIWNDEYLSILDPQKPIIVITYPHSIHTVSNIFESQITAALCCLYKLTLGNDFKSDDFINNRIGIVTPHRAQRSQIQNLLLESDIELNDRSFIDTVDRFQGQERDLVIASYTVSDKDFVASEESFILDPRRFNVSLTRAKSKFIMIVSDAIIDHLSNDKDVATDAAHLQMFVIKFCNKINRMSLNYFENKVLKEMNCRVRHRE